MILSLAILSLAGCRQPAPPAAKSAAPEADQPQRLSAAMIQVNGLPLLVEVAREKGEHEKGMMYRSRLGPDEAMLFVFDRDTNLSFWMKNTAVDLDLAYLRSDGEILQTERLTAFDLTPVYSRGPARFALELPAGWLESHGVAVGSKVTIPPEATAPSEPGP